MPREHQPDEDRFRAILPEDVAWQPFPAFPAGNGCHATSSGRIARNLSSSG